MKELFGRYTISWQSAFYYFQKWSKDGSWHKLFTSLSDANLRMLNLSSVQLDGSHTPVKRGGLAVGYQGRKSAKNSNMLFLTDRQGIPLGCSEPMSGLHNDLFEIEKMCPKFWIQ